MSGEERNHFPFVSHKVALALLLLLSALIFAPAYKGEPFADEASFAGKFKPYSTEVKYAFSQLDKWDGYFRPVPLLFIMGEYKLASFFASEKGPDQVYTGAERAVISVTNFALHACNTFLVFLICGLLLNGKKNFEWLALCGAAWWGLNPIHTEAVAWRAAQFDLFATFFWLLFLFFALKHIIEERLIYCVLASLSLLCAIMSKESAYAAPFTLAALVLMLPKEIELGVTKRRRMWTQTAVAVLSTAAVYAAMRTHYLDWKFNMSTKASAGTFFKFFHKVLAFDLVKLVFPWPQRPFIPEAFSTGAAIPILALFAAALVLLLRWKAMAKRVTLGLVLFLAATISPTFIYFMNPDQYGVTIAREVALYAPTLGVAFFIAIAASKIKLREPLAKAAIGVFMALLGVFAFSAYSYSHVFQSNLSFLREAVKPAWGGDRDRWENIALGDAYADAGEYGQAMRHYGVSLDPANADRVVPRLKVYYEHLGRTKYATAALNEIKAKTSETKEKAVKAQELCKFTLDTIIDLPRTDHSYRDMSMELMPLNLKVLGISRLHLANAVTTMTGKADLAGFSEAASALKQTIFMMPDREAEMMYGYAKSVKTIADIRTLQ